MRQAEKGKKKKNLFPNSVQTRPGQEHSQKNSKKIQEIIKPIPGVIFSQNGDKIGRKSETKFYSRIPIITNPGKKIPKKKGKKIQKII